MQRVAEGRLRRVFGIAGYKNAGKTTLIVALVRELTGRGFRVGTVKHAHHDFDIDHPGKDSHAHRQAGAVEVIVASARRVAHITELQPGTEPALAALVAALGPVDVVLVEGWKSGTHPRLELRRAAAPAPALAPAAGGVVALVTDQRCEAAGLPVFAPDQTGLIADFILQTLGLPQKPPAGRPDTGAAS